MAKKKAKRAKKTTTRKVAKKATKKKTARRAAKKATKKAAKKAARKVVRKAAKKTTTRGAVKKKTTRKAARRPAAPSGHELQSALSDLATAFERLGMALGQGVKEMAESAGSRILGEVRRGAAKTRAAAGRAKTAGKKKRRVTPQQRAALKLQGRYMAATRFLSPADKEKVRRTRERRGIEAATAQALKIGGGTKK